MILTYIAGILCGLPLGITIAALLFAANDEEE